MDENFSALSDPDFLALRRRVREELEHTPEHEISASLAARYARLDEEFLRRASLAWTQTANGLGETTMSELATLHSDTAPARSAKAFSRSRTAGISFVFAITAGDGERKNFHRCDIAGHALNS